MLSVDSPYGTGHMGSTSSTSSKLLPVSAQKYHEPSRVAMRLPPAETLTKMAKGAWLPVGISGVGTGAWLVLAHQGHGPIPIMVGAIVAVVGIACASAPKIIAARSEAAISRARAEAIRLQASSDSEAQMLHAQTHAALLRIGVDESKIGQVERMLRYQLLYQDLPKGRRLNDRALVELAKEEMKKSIETAKPGARDSSSDHSTSTSGELPSAANGDSSGGNGGVVLNMHSEE
jgi:hypothetical protein